MTDLDTATTEELIEELQDRCESMVLAFDPIANKEEKIQFHATGSMHARIGLIHMLKLQLENKIERVDLDDD